MSLTENLVHIASNMQQGIKLASITVSQRILRLITGLFLGVVISLIIQEFAQSGTFVFLFFMTLILGLTYKLLRPLTLFQILVFDFICVLISVTLRMYIMIAPNLT